MQTFPVIWTSAAEVNETKMSKSLMIVESTTDTSVILDNMISCKLCINYNEGNLPKK